MDDLLAREHAAQQNVYNLMKGPDEAVMGTVLAAFNTYRSACQAVVFADFIGQAKQKEEQLWHAHVAGKQFLSQALRNMRRDNPDAKVEIRGLQEWYLKWIKLSVRFYRDHVHKISVAFGVPELQAVALAVKSDESPVASHHVPVLDDNTRAKITMSCHQTLIYLGDLSRYRASEKLDKKPDFGPAIGYYGLASRICPSSGMGHHQQAVIALEQKEHLRAIYHLYRSICVTQPHPLAQKNLRVEFDKTISAWDKNELIKKGPPNDPDASKKVLVGWYVRLQSICFKGEKTRGFDELEREVLTQLANILKQRDLDTALARMVLVNIAAQHTSIENYKNEQTPQNEKAFFSSLRVNLRFYTTLLGIFQDDLLHVARNPGMGDAELIEKVLPASIRVLPALRMYSTWLLTNVHLLFGLTADPALESSIESFWKTYGRSLDLVATIFPIWDLEDVALLEYVLEDDVEVLGFEPLSLFGDDKTDKFWVNKQNALQKPRFSDRAVERRSAVEESLARIYGFLEDGLYVANDLTESPIKIKGTRVFYGNGEELEQLVLPATLEKPVIKKTPSPPQAAPKATSRKAPGPAPIAKPLSYAAAAANSKAKVQAPKPVQRPIARPNGVPTLAATPSQQAQDVQLSRMVDDLVDDDEIKDPVTPPQQYISDPAVAHTNGDFSMASLRDSTPDYGSNSATEMGKTPIHRPHGKLPSVSSLWPTSPNGVMASSTSPKFPPGLPVGTLSSPAAQGRGHSRVNSANSVRSRASQNVGDSWSSLESLPQGTGMGRNAATLPGLGGYGESALLFGAGGGMWSAGGGGTRRSFGATSPDANFGG